MEKTSKEYQLPADDLRTVNKHAMQSGAFLVFMFGVIAWVVEYSRRNEPDSSIPTWAIMIPLAVWVIIRQYKKSKNEWQTYRLIIQPDGSLLRTAASLPHMTITPGEISQIQEVQDTCIMVKTKSPHQFIVIPSKLIGLDQVRAHLQSLKQIEPIKPKFQVLQLLIASAAGVGLTWAAFMSKDRQLSIIATAILASFLVWLLIYSRNDKSISSKEKALRTFGFIVFCFTLLINLIIKIFPSVQTFP